MLDLAVSRVQNPKRARSEVSSTSTQVVVGSTPKGRAATRCAGANANEKRWVAMPRRYVRPGRPGALRDRPARRLRTGTFRFAGQRFRCEGEGSGIGRESCAERPGIRLSTIAEGVA